MSTFYFTINEYLVNGGPEVGYVLHDPNDPTSRIITNQTTYAVDGNYRAIGGQVGARSNPALSFNIRRRPNDEWYMMINQQTFAGKYPSQAACLGVLYGIMTHNDGLDEDGFPLYLAEALDNGSSTIDAAENVLTLSHTDNDISVTLSEYDSSYFISDLPFFGYEIIDVDGSYIPLTISTIAGQCSSVTVSEGGSQTTVKTGAWFDLAEGQGARPVLVGYNSTTGVITVVAYGPGQSKPSAAPVIDFDVAVSGTNGLPATDVELGGFAYAVITDSSTDGTPSFTYEWYQSVPTLTGITLTNEGT